VSLPPAYTAASARAAGLTRAQLRSSRFVRLAHDFVVCLDDAIDQRERLALLAGLLPADAAYSHGTAAALLGTHVDMPVRAHVAMTPRRVLPQRAEFVVHTRRLAEEDVVVHRGLRTTSGPQTWLDLAERLPPHELVAVGDALMRGGHLAAEALAGRLERATRGPRCGARPAVRTPAHAAVDVTSGESGAVLAGDQRSAGPTAATRHP
jgi:hypothetical protein